MDTKSAKQTVRIDGRRKVAVRDGPSELKAYLI